jgi:bifunctional enzyme CysN/CysC
MDSRPLLRLLTCGAVDDGKSTLIGRLLHDAGLIADDTLATLARDSRRHGTTGADTDLALLTDGLEAEREQGITIDVAWRYFATPARHFILADCPGHAQHTRNMATGAARADLAILLVDARAGLLPQTHRHAAICALFGIRHLVVALNKLDLAGFDQAVFDRIAAEARAMADALAIPHLATIPVSARHGDNIARPSARTPWYAGPTLLHHLETVQVEVPTTARAFRFPVQWVNRPDDTFRGLAGTVASGRIAPGDPVVVAQSGATSHIARILGPNGDQSEAAEGDAVTLVLATPLDAARGDLLAPPTARPDVADQFAAHLLWTDDTPLLPGRQYRMRLGTAWTTASVTTIRHRLDPQTQAHEAATTLAANEIALCHLATATPIAFDPYAANRATGAFILVDRDTNRTAAAGMIAHPLRRATNIHREAYPVDKPARSRALRQRPLVLWFTGLSASGKTTVAKLVEQHLHHAGHATFALDGDNLRHGLNRDLGFTPQDRVENIRRAGEVAKLMAEAGLVVLASFISPYRADRRLVREMLAPGEFVEIHMDTPLDLCAARDPKGLYARARAGEIPNFTGINSPYEPPEPPDLTLDGQSPPETLAHQVLAHILPRISREA